MSPVKQPPAAEYIDPILVTDAAYSLQGSRLSQAPQNHERRVEGTQRTQVRFDAGIPTATMPLRPSPHVKEKSKTTFTLPPSMVK